MKLKEKERMNEILFIKHIYIHRRMKKFERQQYSTIQKGTEIERQKDEKSFV